MKRCCHCCGGILLCLAHWLESLGKSLQPEHQAEEAFPRRLAQSLEEHGYVVVRKVIPEAIVDGVKQQMIEDGSFRLSIADDKHMSRTSVNNKCAIFISGWRNLIGNIVHPGNLCAQIMKERYGDQWWYDISGGDAVCPNADFVGGPCSPHSDWSRYQ